MFVQRTVGEDTKRINVPHRTIIVARRPKTKIDSVNNENQGSQFIDPSAKYSFIRKWKNGEGLPIEDIMEEVEKFQIGTFNSNESFHWVYLLKCTSAPWIFSPSDAS